MNCAHLRGVWCILDPKFHKPNDAERERYCMKNNINECPIYEKFGGKDWGPC